MLKLTRFLVPSCIGRRSENIFSTTGGAQTKRKDRMKLSLPTKLVEKQIWGSNCCVL